MLKSRWRASVLSLVVAIPLLAQQPPAPPAPTVHAAPQPGTEAALRRLLAEVSSGAPNYDLLVPAMATMLRQQLPQLQKDLLALGQLQSITFAKARMQGADLFDVKLANGALNCMIGLDAAGKVAVADCREAGSPPQQ